MERSQHAMPKFSAQEALKHLGGSAAQIERDLRGFREAASVLSSDHPRMIDDHPLQWIGVYEGKVAATGRSLKSLMSQLRKRAIPPEETIIRFIDREERALIL
jgi:hypothetical protein